MAIAIKNISSISELSCSYQDFNINLRSLAELRVNKFDPDKTAQVYVLGDLAYARLSVDPTFHSAAESASVLEHFSSGIICYLFGTPVCTLHAKDFNVGAAALLTLRKEPDANGIYMIEHVEYLRNLYDRAR